MATLKDLAGTISNQFAIGEQNIKIMTGSNAPTNEIGNVGDLYITNNVYIDSDEIFATYANMVAYTSPEDGEIYEVTTDETKDNKTTYYNCIIEGGVATYILNSYKGPAGKVYIKDVETNTNGAWKEVGTGAGGATTIKYW